MKIIETKGRVADNGSIILPPGVLDTKRAPYLTGSDETLFHSIVNQIVVTEQDKLKFCLIGGFAFTEQLPKEVFGR